MWSKSKTGVSDFKEEVKKKSRTEVQFSPGSEHTRGDGPKKLKHLRDEEEEEEEMRGGNEERESRQQSNVSVAASQHLCYQTVCQFKCNRFLLKQELNQSIPTPFPHLPLFPDPGVLRRVELFLQHKEPHCCSSRGVLGLQERTARRRSCCFTTKTRKEAENG